MIKILLFLIFGILSSKIAAGQYIGGKGSNLTSVEVKLKPVSNNPLCYPNPVKSGEVIKLYGFDEVQVSEVFISAVSGARLGNLTGFGLVYSIPEGLPGGVYLARVKYKSGEVITVKLMVLHND